MDPIVTVLFLLPPGIPFPLTLYPPLTYLEAWDATAPQSLPTLVMGADPGLGAVITAPFVFLVIYNPIWGGIYPSPFIPNVPWDAFHSPRNESFPSLSNNGEVVFAALDNGQHYLGTLITPPEFAHKTDTPPRARIANGGNIVFEESGKILAANYDLTVIQEVAGPSNGFVSVGKSPGISDDGKIVVFYGELNPAWATYHETTPGPGVFAAVEESPVSPSPRVFTIVRVTGRTAELGYSAVDITSPVPKPIDFKPDGYDPDSRISVLRQDLGKPSPFSDFPGDSFVVSFMATPSAPSRLNPATGKPFFFTGQKGLWTVRVDVEPNLSPMHSLLTNYHTTMPQPVVQIGDVISGGSVKDIGVYDSIAAASTDDLGNPRPVAPRRGDHRVVFWVDTDAGHMIVGASRLDSDEDGLLDHWETDGLDMDSDGVVDLNLNAMGANPFKRDLFLEIDWLVPRNDIGFNPFHSNEPAPGVTKDLVDMFANAPGLPNGIPAGITLHIDAGPGCDTDGQFFSHNMGNVATRQGGDLIGQVGSNAHIDVVYFGIPGRINVPGVEARSLHDIKDVYCLIADKGARELVFHYVVLCDFHDLHERLNTVYSVHWATNDDAGKIGILQVDSDLFVNADGTAMNLMDSTITVSHNCP
jgi:hypothetical protein